MTPDASSRRDPCETGRLPARRDLRLERVPSRKVYQALFSGQDRGPGGVTALRVSSPKSTAITTQNSTGFLNPAMSGHACIYR